MSSVFSGAASGRSTPIHWLRWILCITSWYNVLVGEGRYAEAEKSWQQLREVQRRVFGPEDVQTAVSTYNLACVAAHEGKRDEALSLLREAIDHGIPPSLGLGIESDSDLQSLHGDPRFDAVVAHAKEHAAAAAKQQ